MQLSFIAVLLSLSLLGQCEPQLHNSCHNGYFSGAHSYHRSSHINLSSPLVTPTDQGGETHPTPQVELMKSQLGEGTTSTGYECTFEVQLVEDLGDRALMELDISSLGITGLMKEKGAANQLALEALKKFPFFYIQDCNLYIIHMLVAPGETPEVVEFKKGLIESLHVEEVLEKRNILDGEPLAAQWRRMVHPRVLEEAESVHTFKEGVAHKVEHKVVLSAIPHGASSSSKRGEAAGHVFKASSESVLSLRNTKDTAARRPHPERAMEVYLQAGFKLENFKDNHSTKKVHQERIAGDLSAAIQVLASSNRKEAIAAFQKLQSLLKDEDALVELSSMIQQEGITKPEPFIPVMNVLAAVGTERAQAMLTEQLMASLENQQDELAHHLLISMSLLYLPNEETVKVLHDVAQRTNSTSVGEQALLVMASFIPTLDEHSRSEEAHEVMNTVELLSASLPKKAKLSLLLNSKRDLQDNRDNDFTLLFQESHSKQFGDDSMMSAEVYSTLVQLQDNSNEQKWSYAAADFNVSILHNYHYSLASFALSGTKEKDSNCGSLIFSRSLFGVQLADLRDSVCTTHTTDPEGTCHAHYTGSNPHQISSGPFGQVIIPDIPYPLGPSGIFVHFSLSATVKPVINYAWQSQTSDHSGDQFLGYIEPEITVQLNGEVRGEIPLLVSIGVHLDVTVLDAGLSASSAYNFLTQRGCEEVSLHLNAFGGYAYAFGSIPLCFSFCSVQYPLYQWDNPLAFDTILGENSCCVYCEPSCLQGDCSLMDGTCDCFNGWDGSHCEIECPAQCQGLAPGVQCMEGQPPSCSCEEGRYSLNCGWECPGGAANPCNGHGTCNDLGQCYCEDHWKGLDCSQECPGSTTCSGHGTCYYDGAAKCDCDQGYGGPACEYQCPIGSNGQTCGGLGHCDVNVNGQATCFCYLGVAGDTCEDRHESPGRVLRIVDESGRVVLPPMDIEGSFTWIGNFWWDGTSSGFLVSSGTAGHVYVDQPTSSIRFQSSSYYISAQIEAGKWHAFAATFSDSEVIQWKLYVDAVLVADAPQMERTIDFSAPTYFGSGGFTGYIDNFALFSFAVPAELIHVFHSRIPSWFAPGIVGLWLFDEIVGIYVYDDFLLSHNGELDGTVYRYSAFGTANKVSWPSSSIYSVAVDTHDRSVPLSFYDIGFSPEDITDPVIWLGLSADSITSEVCVIDFYTNCDFCINPTGSFQVPAGYSMSAYYHFLQPEHLNTNKPNDMLFSMEGQSSDCIVTVAFPQIEIGLPALTINGGLTHPPMWTLCPGISPDNPDAICSSDFHTHRGKCKRPEYRADDPKDKFKAFSCECASGYFGQDCSKECPGKSTGAVCSNHGVCMLLGTDAECLCNENYYGKNCEISCPGASDNVCSGRGSCSRNGNVASCKCDASYFGYNCEHQLSNSPDTHTTTRMTSNTITTSDTKTGTTSASDPRTDTGEPSTTSTASGTATRETKTTAITSSGTKSTGSDTSSGTDETSEDKAHNATHSNGVAIGVAVGVISAIVVIVGAIAATVGYRRYKNKAMEHHFVELRENFME